MSKSSLLKFIFIGIGIFIIFGIGYAFLMISQEGVVQEKISRENSTAFSDPCLDLEDTAEAPIDCYLKLGEQRGNEVCDLLEGADEEKTASAQGSCDAGVAVVRGDFSGCVEAQVEKRQQACAFAFAYATGEVGRCTFLPSGSEQQACIGVVAAKRVRDGGQSLSQEECTVFLDPTTRDVCETVAEYQSRNENQ